MIRPPLRELDGFAAVARHRSFRAAARETGVSASTLSQQIRDLELRLGKRLLHRTTRSVAPTEAGARLLERLTPALGEIAEALDQIHGAQGEAAGTLRINAPLPAIDLVLAPLVGPFLAAHPHVRLEITAEAALVDIVAAGCDAGVRWGEDLAQDVVAVPLGPAQRFAVVASPDCLARLGAPIHPRDLLARPCIRQLLAGGKVPAWEFERGGETLRLRPQGPLVSSSVALQLRAAVDGAGFAVTFADHARADIAAGRLVEVLEDWCPAFPGPFLYYPRQRLTPAPLAAFVRFVRGAHEIFARQAGDRV